MAIVTDTELKNKRYVYLKTSGSMVGEAKQGIEADSISPDLDAE